MNKERGIEFVKASLAANKPEQEIITVLTTRTKMTEQQARQFVAYVRSNHRQPAHKPASSQPAQPAQDEALARYVIKSLSRHVKTDDIIYYLCDHSTMSWEQARSFVDQVQRQHQQTIAKQQLPITALLSIGGILAGLLILILGVGGLIALLTQTFSRSISLPRQGQLFIYSLIALPIGIGMLLRSSSALRGQLADARVGGILVKQLQQLVQFILHYKWVLSGIIGILAVVAGITHYVTNIYVPMATPTPQELSHSLISAINNNDFNAALALYGNANSCAEERAVYRPDRQLEGVWRQFGNEAYTVLQIRERGDGRRIGAEVFVQNSNGVISSMLVGTNHCGWGVRCICGIGSFSTNLSLPSN